MPAKSSAGEKIFARVQKALRTKLDAAVSGTEAVFSGVCESAQPFVAALIARDVSRRVWIICKDSRAQEAFASEMSGWCDRVRLFPDLELPVDEAALPDPETVSERLDLLVQLAGKGSEVVVIHESQLEGDVPAPHVFDKAFLRFKKGAKADPDVLCKKLEAAGYEPVPRVFARGQFARRGGILDVFSWQQQNPLRLEFFDDVVESLRVFNMDTQSSLEEVETGEVLAGKSDAAQCPLRQYLKAGDFLLAIEGESGSVEITSAPSVDGTGDTSFHPHMFGDFGAGDLVLDEVKRERFFGQLSQWIREEWMVALACNNEGEWERFCELAAEHDCNTKKMILLSAPLTRGFVFPGTKVTVLADAELFGRAASQRLRRLTLRRERMKAGRATTDFAEFEEDDFVVHIEHGIGRYLGLQMMPGMDGSPSEVLALEFANEAKLYVPLDQAWQVARYVGLGKRHPDLSVLGEGKWQRATRNAQKSIYDYATEMLKVQAERDTGQGHAFPPDNRWQKEFEASFLFKETIDQLRAIEESKADMESRRPMDRLICGDVGFGKTEVAIRAAFKAVMGGRQAAVIAPTTVLAQQHFETFRERMSDYPVTIEMLSRYRTAAEQRAVVKRLAEGGVDIVIGTHRIISPDVKFKDLGLVVVDEEQRFGVKHKDALKERFRLVDVLTLSATPIPRTLYLALMGARDMSLIETPPANRQPVETIICAYDERILRDAITRELARGGQVYLLHNRVRTIEKVASRIRELCPGARVVVGHGQMGEHELEAIMKTFVAGKSDVLVSTTIIESGLDIPNANTIIIDRADRFGLADLYQLRGRVGRSQLKAHAYLMLPRDLMSVGAARKRVSAIKQYSELGAGFKIAMRDLEIRGAGNLLGTAQSGHILAIGFDLYCKLLRRAVESLKGERPPSEFLTTIWLDFLTTNEGEFASTGDKAGGFLPVSYVPDAKTRIECHRKLAEARSRDEIEVLRREWRDRFGPLPPVAENVLLLAALRIEGAIRRFSRVESREGKIMLTKRGDFVLVGGRFPRLTASTPDSRLRELLDFVTLLPLR